jgi:hypothetical protein
MGFEISFGSLVRGIVDGLRDKVAFHPTYEGKGKMKHSGVMFMFGLSVSSYTDKVSARTSELLGIIFLYPHITFIATGLQRAQDWQMTSSHDTCYVSDGIDSPVSKLYFKMCEEVNRQRKAGGQGEIAPMHMSSHAHFQGLKLVEVFTDPDPKETGRYQWRIIDKIIYTLPSL